jgi:hypothetical protein
MPAASDPHAARLAFQWVSVLPDRRWLLMAFPAWLRGTELSVLRSLPERLRLRPSSSLLTWSFPLAYAILSMLTQGPAVT